MTTKVDATIEGVLVGSFHYTKPFAVEKDGVDFYVTDAENQNLAQCSDEEDAKLIVAALNDFLKTGEIQ